MRRANIGAGGDGSGLHDCRGIARAAAIRRTRRRAAALVHFGAHACCTYVCTGPRARAQPDGALLQRRQAAPPPLLHR
jgi:hypothetical protein